MIILGLNAFHADSSAALVKDGRLIAAAEEERFRRIKHWAGLPSQAMAYCLETAGIDFADLEHVAINLNPRVHHGRRLRHILRYWPSPKLILNRLKKLGRSRSVADAIAA